VPADVWIATSTGAARDAAAAGTAVASIAAAQSASIVTDRMSWRFGQR
jgi:hypothetical protein